MKIGWLLLGCLLIPASVGAADTGASYDAPVVQQVEGWTVKVDPQMLTPEYPYAVFHELAHAYHDQVLGFDDPEIEALYDAAKHSGTYDTTPECLSCRQRSGESFEF